MRCPFDGRANPINGVPEIIRRYRLAALFGIKIEHKNPGAIRPVSAGPVSRATRARLHQDVRIQPGIDIAARHDDADGAPGGLGTAGQDGGQRHRAARLCDQLQELKSLAREPYTLVFFEAPHRLVRTIEEMIEVLGERPAVIFKEMTKMFEQVLAGSLGELLERIRPAEEVRGEYTLVVSGREKGEEQGGLGRDVEDRIDHMLKAGGMSVRDMAQEIASQWGLDYRDVYKVCIQRKRAL